MTIDSARLLQMLEPTVRPGAPGRAASAQPVGKPAFEKQTFEQLLAGVQTRGGGENGMAVGGAGLGLDGRALSSVVQAAEDEANSAASQGHGPLGLSGLDRIENAGLRSVLAQVQAKRGVGA